MFFQIPPYVVGTNDPGKTKERDNKFNICER
jgi:hypothetical protein